jgi:hypothetical protein
MQRRALRIEQHGGDAKEVQRIGDAPRAGAGEDGGHAGFSRRGSGRAKARLEGYGRAMCLCRRHFLTYARESG